MTLQTESERSAEAQQTKTICICDGAILVDESVFGLGIRCVKCGLSSDIGRPIRGRNPNG